MTPLKFFLAILYILAISNSYSQVGIGTTSPDASSVLDVVASDKGLLIPRVSLATITTTMLDGTNTSATGLLIYNTNAAVVGGNGLGYYYFNGTFWEKLITSASYIQKIDDLLDGKSDNDGTQDGSSVFLGINAGLNDDSSDNKNVGVGFETLQTNSSGTGNIANGYQALYSNTGGNWNVANGYWSLTYNTSGSANTANGSQSLFSNTDGYNNTANGYQSMYSNTSGADNVASGLQSLYTNTIGINNTAYGVRSLYLNTEGSENSATGDRSLFNNTTGRFNTANGSQSLFSNTIGQLNTANGYEALILNTEGNNNAANGSRSLYSNTLGNDNTANGFRALYTNIDGDFNTASGSFSLFFNSTGNQNIGVGHESLISNTTGSYNIGIGSRTGAANSTGSNNIYLGHSAGTPETGSNKLYIENSNANADNALIYGEFDTNILRTNSQFQIGNPSSTGFAFPTIDGTVNQVMQTDGTGTLSWVDSSTIGSNDADWFEEGTTNAPNDINDDMFTMGNVAIGKNTADYPLDVNSNSAWRGINIELSGADNAPRTGIYSSVTNTGDNGHTGFTNYLIVDGNGNHWGIRTQVSGSGSGWKSANINSVYGDGTGIMTGTFNNINGTGDGEHGGTDNIIQNDGGGTHFGTRNRIRNNSGNGLQYGVLNELEGSGGGDHYGNYSLLSGSGSGDKYGSYNEIESAAGGTHYGVYSKINNFGGYAGYFLGRVSLGTATTNNYILPLSRGTANQIMQTDGSGNVSWVDTDVAISHRIDDLLDAKSDNDGSNNGSSIYFGVDSGLTDDGTDNRNVGVGYQSSRNIVSGTYNTVVGYNSLYFNTSGNGNVAVGVSAGFNNGGNNNVFLGYYSGYNEAGNDKLYIENSNANANNALIYGEFDNNILRTNSQFQIGNPTGTGFAFPTTDGVANQIMQTDGSGNLIWVDEVSVGTDDQNISGSGLSGTTLTIGIENGTSETVDLSSLQDGIGTDNQNLTSATLTGNTLQIDIENGTSTSVDLSALNTGGDITNVTAGTGLTGGGNSGAVTLNVIASNGLTANTNNIVLGGTLTQATTITQGTNALTFNLNGTGDFRVQDNGTTHFEVRDTGLTYFGDDTYWNDGSTTGTTIARLYDNGNDGVFEIFKDALVQHQFNSAGTSVINELGQDFDFRIEGNNDANLFYADAGTDRIGIMENTPSFDLHLKQSTNTQNGAGGIGFENSANSNNWKIYHDGSNLSFAENGTRRGYITAGTGLYMPTSDRRLKKSITEVESILDKVNTLKAYHYLYKDQEISAKKTIGFMAQDVQPLFPELVGQAEDGYFALNYSGFGVVAIKAIQEQQVIIDTQQQQIEALQKSQEETETLISALLKRIEKQENQD